MTSRAGSDTSENGAFAALLAGHTARLRLLIAHLAGPRLRAHLELDDLVQDTLLRALSSSQRPAADELERWLNTLARRATIDAARALQARRRGATALRLERADWSKVGLRESAVSAHDVGVLTKLGADDEQRRLLAAFERLSPEHRRVIGLRQFEGLSAAQAAQRLQRSESAVHSLYRRALEAWAEAAR